MDTASNDSKRNDELAPADLLSRPQGNGPGPRIREARVAAGLSVGEFATQLRLTVATLDALESDDFQTLREPVYVRGYYRKVAKLLPLKEQDLIAAYDRVAMPKAAVAAVPSKLLLASSESEGRDPRVVMRWLLAAVLVILGLLVVGVLFSRHERAATAAASGDAPATANQEPAVAAPAEGAAAKPSEAAPTAAAPATATNPQPSFGTAAAPALQPAAPAQPEPAHPAPTASTTDNSSGLAPASPAANPVAATPAAETGSAALVLDFRDQSWAEVFDASGKRLLSGMMRAGAHETLAGRPPYSVFLGNAPKVDVSFGGQHVDLGSRVRDNATARFQIPLN